MPRNTGRKRGLVRTTLGGESSTTEQPDAAQRGADTARAPPEFHTILGKHPRDEDLHDDAEEYEWGSPRTQVVDPALLYRCAVETGHALVVQIDPITWVAQLYDPRNGDLLFDLNHWAHVYCKPSAEMHKTYHCSCSIYGRTKSCIHVALFHPRLPDVEVFDNPDNPPAVPFFHDDETETLVAYTVFSCAASIDAPRGSRVFVSHTGRKSEVGEWSCSSHHHVQCKHIDAAQDIARIQGWIPLLDAEATDESRRAELANTQTTLAETNAKLERLRERPVSHRPIGPPKWARLPSDILPSIPTIRDIPAVLSIDDDARCRCGAGRVPDAELLEIDCVIYCLDAAHQRRIQVHLCPKCPRGTHQYVGADLGTLGLFNFNNVKIYAHDLLNDFTNHFTAAEVPFNAFWSIMCRRYKMNDSPIPFAHDDDFRTAWFSFAMLQHLEDSFRCEICGDNCADLVADGVTVAFETKRTTGTIHPPTLPHNDSTVRTLVQPVPGGLRLVRDDRLRQEALRLLAWASGHHASEVAQHDGTAVDPDSNPAGARRQAKAKRARESAESAKNAADATKVASQLAKVNEGLGNLFAEHVTSKVNATTRDAHKPYHELLRQLLAHESVLQFASGNEETITLLTMIGNGDFVDAQLHDASHRLRLLVPALGVVVRKELQQNGNISEDLCTILLWVAQSAQSAYSTLRVHATEPAQLDLPQEDWTESGVYYPQGRVRSRPIYPGLKSDGAVDRGTMNENDTIGCPKHYQLYRKEGLTGGLLALWCTHSICLGFHCIPKGEGRNDVFSALYTYWPTAPRTVIYDFACALAPYCMLREPEFFQNTKFLVDKFHAEGHNQCSRACFLSNYEENEMYAQLNSSAGECGNSGLRRIRKSIRYMSQRHAIIFVMVFLRIWNRMRRQGQQTTST